MNVTKPQDFHPSYAEAFNSGNVDAVSSHYRVRRATGAGRADRGRLRSPTGGGADCSTKDQENVDDCQ